MDLKELIERGETQSLEFKESLRLKEEIGETVSAFSNTNEGVVLVGVSDGGEPNGVDIGGNTLEELANHIKRNTDPQVFPTVKIQEVGGKNVVMIEVAESAEKPVFFKNHAYKRVGKTNQMISTSEIRKLAREEKRRLSWGEQICEDAGLEDIDEEKVRWFLRRAKEERGLAIEEGAEIYDILTQLNLLQDTKLANAAILLFGKDPERFFMQSEVKCIALPTTEFVKPYDTYQTYGGNLFEQVDKATTFTLENIRRPLWVEPGEVAAKHPYELPKEALREAIVNAIIHREYDSPSKVQIRVFPDRVEIWNPGCLPSQLTIGDLKKPHPSIPSNPSLFRQFYRVAYVEDVGGGTLDIIKRCGDTGLPEPEFEEKMGFFVVTFLRSTVTDEYLEKIGVNERQHKAIKFIRQKGRIQRSEYVELCNCSPKTAYNDIQDLVKKDILIASGKGKRTYYMLRGFYIKAGGM
jgi:ATP-dependent DNA helicase RecG